MPKRAQIAYNRPQDGFKTQHLTATYNRTPRDESKADAATFRGLNFIEVDEPKYKTKSKRRVIKRNATVKKVEALLGIWVREESKNPCVTIYPDLDKITVEPSKYFTDKYVWEELRQTGQVGVVTKKAYLYNLQQVTKRFLLINKNRTRRFHLSDKYADYKDNRSFITQLTKEEREFERNLEQLKLEKEQEPFFNWLSN
jgi:hypothetical protein